MQQCTVLSGKNDEISVADIRKELFENDNVVVGNNDHGLSKLGIMKEENQGNEEKER